jgi:hypothetical protein
MGLTAARFGGFTLERSNWCEAAILLRHAVAKPRMPRAAAAAFTRHQLDDYTASLDARSQRAVNGAAVWVKMENPASRAALPFSMTK